MDTKVTPALEIIDDSANAPTISHAHQPAPPGGSAGTVFIQANHRQIVGAMVAAHAIRSATRHPDAFDIRLVNPEYFAFFQEHEGLPYLKHGQSRAWRNDDLQSFTPTRFMPPELLAYQGRAVVIDPDIFAVADIHELLTTDMKGAAILCRRKPHRPGWNSSVMLLDCAKLTHWDCRRQFEAMFEFKRDYADWNSLLLEPEGSIGLMDEQWNCFDELTDNTRMLHNTNRRTQPWKTHLPIEFTPSEKFPKAVAPLVHWVRRHFASMAGVGRYRRHPDRRQERFFFEQLQGALQSGLVSRAFIEAEMEKQHLRQDALKVIDQMAKQTLG